jgi:hypothetical protein
MAEGKRNKPTPKTQSELTREQITPYDGRGAAPASSKTKRENQISLKDDTVKLPLVGFKDIDGAIIHYFNNVIRPSVAQNGAKIDVPVLYGSPERWAAIQKDGFYRDKDGKIQVPLIMFKKSNIEKNRALGNKLDGNEVNNFIIYEKKYSKRNIYDRFSVISNRNPSQELYGVVVPDYVTVTYQCVIFTDYVEQCDKLIEALNFASDSYWGDPERYRFRAMIDSYTPTIEVVQGQDRGVKATFSIKLHGYIITDTYNRDKANLKKFYSKAQVNFKMETAGTLEELEQRPEQTVRPGSIRFSDTDLNRPQEIREGMTLEEIVYLTTKNATIADSLSGTTGTCNGISLLTPPPSFGSLNLSDFEVYLNGRRIPTSQVNSITQVGSNVEIDIDIATYLQTPGAILEEGDKVLLIGKFT